MAISQEDGEIALQLRPLQSLVLAPAPLRPVGAVAWGSVAALVVMLCVC